MWIKLGELRKQSCNSLLTAGLYISPPEPALLARMIFRTGASMEEAYSLLFICLDRYSLTPMKFGYHLIHSLVSLPYINCFKKL